MTRKSVIARDVKRQKTGRTLLGQESGIEGSIFEILKILMKKKWQLLKNYKSSLEMLAHQE